jgi:hypothetical protein
MHHHTSHPAAPAGTSSPAALAIITALIVAPVTAAADTRPGGSATATALTQAFQSSRHIPVGSPGS